MRIHGKPHYTMMLSAVFLQRCSKIVFYKASQVHKTSLKARFVATMSMGHYWFGFRPLWAGWGFSALACYKSIISA